MSCHDIGRGMNSVVEIVIKLFDEGKIEKDVARTIIAACRKGVYWCDGNQEEAIQSIRRCRCGKCLEIIEKGKYLFSVWDVSNDVPNRYNILDKGDPILASDGLCEKCFNEVINKHCNDDNAGKREQAYIISEQDKEYYLSEGIKS